MTTSVRILSRLASASASVAASQRPRLLSCLHNTGRYRFSQLSGWLLLGNKAAFRADDLVGKSTYIDHTYIFCSLLTNKSTNLKALEASIGLVSDNISSPIVSEFSWQRANYCPHRSFLSCRTCSSISSWTSSGRSPLSSRHTAVSFRLRERSQRGYLDTWGAHNFMMQMYKVLYACVILAFKGN